jgi:nucleoside-diphosphate-sugar epimerase
MVTNDKLNVLIYGATGWIGRATIYYFIKNYENVDFTLVSSANKQVNFKKKSIPVTTVSDLSENGPLHYDYYFNFAFLTQDKIKNISEDKYLKLTNQIIFDEEKIIKNKEINKSLLISSGAVYWLNTDKENLYTVQKLKQEEFFKDNLKETKNYTARMFALLAEQFDFEKKYAFSSFVSNGLKNEPINIESKIKVQRSYLVFEDLLNYFTTSNESNITFDAWSQNFDILELAKIIGKIYNVEVNASSSYLNSNENDSYISKDNYFEKLINKEINIETIKRIIQRTINESVKIN